MKYTPGDLGFGFECLVDQLSEDAIEYIGQTYNFVELTTPVESDHLPNKMACDSGFRYLVPMNEARPYFGYAGAATVRLPSDVNSTIIQLIVPGC